METHPQSQEFPQQGQESPEIPESNDLIDDDLSKHLDLTHLIATGDFSEEEIEKAIDSSKSRSEVYEKLKKIQGDRMS